MGVRIWVLLAAVGVLNGFVPAPPAQQPCCAAMACCAMACCQPPTTLQARVHRAVAPVALLGRFIPSVVTTLAPVDRLVRRLDRVEPPRAYSPRGPPSLLTQDFSIVG